MTTPPRRLATQLPEISNLVPLAAPFADRDEEVAQVFELLADYQAVLIHDPPDRPLGYGTSQVAVAHCHRYTRHYEMAWMFDCGQERDPARLAARVEREHQRLRAAYERVRDEPLDGPSRADWLYVYDNVADPDAVRRHFPQGNARILVTSRTTGDWDERARVRVGPLEREEAVKLFQEVAALDQRQAERLAETFDGHPGQILRVAEAIRAGIVTPDQFVSLAEIVRMAPAPAERSPLLPAVPPQRRPGKPPAGDRTSLITHLLRSPVCRDTGSYRGWIAALRKRTGVFLDDRVADDLPIRERVDRLLDTAFEHDAPDLLRALADTVQEAAETTGTGRETARAVREIVESAVKGWHGTARPQPPAVRVTSPRDASFFYFTSWANREVYARQVVDFHELLQTAVAARRGRNDPSAGYLDRNMRRGTQWEPLLIEAIRTTRLLVPLITQDYFTSPWCRREWAVMMERIRGVRADEGSEPVAILPVFWVRPPLRVRLPDDFTAFQHRALGGPAGEFPEDVYDLMAEHRRPRLRDYVDALAKCMVEEAQSPLPHLDRDRVLDLPLAFPDANGGAR